LYSNTYIFPIALPIKNGMRIIYSIVITAKSGSPSADPLGEYDGKIYEAKISGKKTNEKTK
jgi:hypothetical protein